MNLSETAAVVAKVQIGDNRRADELVVREWHDVIGHLDFEDTIAAVREHRQTKPGVYLEPGHLVQLVRSYREQRAADAHHKEVTSGRKKGDPRPLNERAMTAAYDAHRHAYRDWLAHPCDEHQAAVDAAYGEVCAEEAEYNRQLMEAGLPPVQNPIPLDGMPTRGGLWS